MTETGYRDESKWRPAAPVNDAARSFQELPGLDLVSAVLNAELADVSDQSLGDGIAAWERITSWARAKQLAWINELNTRAVREFANATRGILEDSPAGMVAKAVGKAKDVPCAELSSILSISHHEARNRVETAVALHSYLFEAGAALEQGAITAGKAELLVTRLAHVNPKTAVAVEAATLPTAHLEPQYQFAKSIEAALISVDPEGANMRLLKARTERRVERPTALPDGMATWRAILPAEYALQAHRALTSAARRARRGGERRTMDQLRADILVDLAVKQHLCPATFEMQDDDRVGRDGFSTDRDEPDGSVDGRSGAGGSGTGRSGIGSSGAGESGPDGSGSGKEDPGAHRCSFEVLVTIPASVLAGIDTNTNVDTDNDVDAKADVATLTGYGPVSGMLARMIAGSPRSRWRLAVTDDRTGRVLDLAQRTYRPPRDLARLIRAREPRCVFPSCHRPSWECDVDHTRPFSQSEPAAGGKTCPGNLAPLCRTHHNLKTLGLWGLSQPMEGMFIWTSPLGRQYQSSSMVRSPNLVTVEDVFGEGVVGEEESSSTRTEDPPITDASNEPEAPPL